MGLVVLFLLSMVGCCLSANAALWLTRASLRPAYIGPRSSPVKRLSLKYAAGSFAILALCAFGGVCSSLIQIFAG